LQVCGIEFREDGNLIHNSYMPWATAFSVAFAVRCCIALVFLLAVCQVHGETERVRVLYIGEPMKSPLPFFVALINDPFFDLTPVQAFTYNLPAEIARRSVRRYMPRTYDGLTGYHTVTLIYADARLFSPQWKTWFSQAVLDGIGFTFSGQDVNRYDFLWEWLESTVGDVLPVERPWIPEIEVMMGEQPGSITVVKPNHPLMASLPWNDMGRHGNFFDCTQIDAKQGSETLAELVTPFGQKNPFLVWWEIGDGRSLAIMTRFSSDHRNADDPFYEWPYLGDFACNFHLFMAGREIPEDVEILHTVRTTWMESYLVKNMLVGSIDFISKLGGNPAPLEAMLKEVEEKLAKSRVLYLEYEFEESLELAERMVGDLGRVSAETVKVKDQVFLTIYLIEWSVLMSTGMVTGVVVWSLMVRRRLYKEAGSTRMSMV